MTPAQQLQRVALAFSALACIASGWPIRSAAAQTTLDRVDPARIEAQVPREPAPTPNAPVDIVRTPATSTAGSAAPITVGAITLAGLDVLRQSDFADIVDAHVGRSLSPAALAALTDALAARARARGFVLATAMIPPQPLTAGILRVDIDEGRVDGIRIVGRPNRAVEAALQPLVGTGPVRVADLERRLLIAGDIDGLWLRRSRVVRDGRRNLLEITLGSDRVTARVGLDNSGSRPIGPLQADLTATIAQVFSDDDAVTFTELVTPTEPSEFGYLRVRYARRVSRSGTEVSASGSFSRTRPGSYLASRDIEGRSWTGRIDVLHPLLRRRVTSLWLSGSFALRDVRQDRRELRARHDRLSVARIGVNGFTQVAGGRLRAGATLSQGLDLFGATGAGDPLASRRDADGVFTTLALTADWTRAITARLSGRVAVASQIASEPLLVSEEIGLGGDYLRAYDYSERSGDEGTMVSAELRWAVAPRLGFAHAPVLYGFVDGGRVTNLDGGFGDGTLFSTGAGVRSRLGDWLDADLSLAVPLSGARYDSGDADPVVNFRLAHRF